MEIIIRNLLVPALQLTSTTLACKNKVAFTFSLAKKIVQCGVKDYVNPFLHSGKNRSAMRQSTRLDLTAPNNKSRLVYDDE